MAKSSAITKLKGIVAFIADYSLFCRVIPEPVILPLVEAHE